MTTEQKNIDARPYLATLRRNPIYSADGKSPRHIAACAGLDPTQFAEFVRDGHVYVSTVFTSRQWARIQEAARERREDCITSPWGLLGHDWTLVRQIARDYSEIGRAFLDAHVLCTANSPTLYRETIAGAKMVCIRVRLDYDRMMYPEKWPATIRRPGQ